VSPRILVVDDEAALRRTLERALRGMGCEVVSAGDAHLAYQMLDETDIDLVLLDLHLPQMAGDTFFLALTRRWPSLADRVVLMTGDTYADQSHWPDTLRRCPLLLKPFTLELLRLTVMAALEGPAPEGRASTGPA
jgi:DNA-binding NtrC family response regulator